MEDHLDEAVTIDLQEMMRVLKKRWFLIMTVFLLAIVTATIASFLIPPVYQTVTTLRITESQSIENSLLNEFQAHNSLLYNQQMTPVYVEIFKSRNVVEKAIAVIRAEYHGNLSYEEVLARLSIQPVKDSGILKISVHGKTPDEARSLVEALLESFMFQIVQMTRFEKSRIKEFIGERLKESERELAKAEEALERYKREQQIIELEAEARALVDQLTTIDKLAVVNQVELTSQQARLEVIQGQLARETPGFIADNSLTVKYKGKLADLEIQLAGLLQKYTDKHPEVIAITAQIEETKRRLNHEIAMVVNAEAPSMNPVHQTLLQNQIAAEATIAAAQAQLKTINDIVISKERIIKNLPAKEGGLARVIRNVTVASELHVMLARRFEEAVISEGMQSAEVQVIDAAVTPKRPVKPNKRLNILMAALVGLFSGIGLAFTWEFFHPTLNDSKDIQKYLKLPVLGSIPNIKLRE